MDIIGASVGARDKEGATPLHLASYTGQYLCAQVLIENGANVNSLDYGGNLHISILYLFLYRT